MTPGRIRLAFASGVLALTVLQPQPAVAADPAATAAPPPSSPATCADRYPADGPAGVDLLLGCIVNEVAQTYLGAGPGSDADPPRISAYRGYIALLAAVLLLMALGVRTVRRRAGRRLASVTPAAWWSCDGCRSLNAAGRTSCYRCGRPWAAGSAELRADAEPLAPQSFGRRADQEAEARRPGPGVER
jgi:hypothetical protein